MIVPFLFILKGCREGDEDEVIVKDIDDDFIKRWVVARANIAGRVVVGIEVPFSIIIKGWREGDEDEVIAKDIDDDFIKRWVVARADVAERVVVGVEVTPIVG